MQKKAKLKWIVKEEIKTFWSHLEIVRLEKVAIDAEIDLILYKAKEIARISTVENEIKFVKGGRFMQVPSRWVNLIPTRYNKIFAKT